VKRERVSNHKHDDLFRGSRHCSTSSPSTLWRIFTTDLTRSSTVTSSH